MAFVKDSARTLTRSASTVAGGRKLYELKFATHILKKRLNDLIILQLLLYGECWTVNGAPKISLESLHRRNVGIMNRVPLRYTQAHDITAEELEQTLGRAQCKRKPPVVKSAEIRSSRFIPSLATDGIKDLNDSSLVTLLESLRRSAILLTEKRTRVLRAWRDKNESLCEDRHVRNSLEQTKVMSVQGPTRKLPSRRAHTAYTVGETCSMI